MWFQAESGKKLTEQSAVDNLRRSLASTHRNELNAVKRPRVGSSADKAKSHLYNFLGLIPKAPEYPFSLEVTDKNWSSEGRL